MIPGAIGGAALNHIPADNVTERCPYEDVGRKMFAGHHSRSRDRSGQGVDDQPSGNAAVLRCDDVGKGPYKDGVIGGHRLPIRPRLGAVRPKVPHSVALHGRLPVDGVAQAGVENDGVGHGFSGKHGGLLQMAVVGNATDDISNGNGRRGTVKAAVVGDPAKLILAGRIESHRLHGFVVRVEGDAGGRSKGEKPVVARRGEMKGRGDDAYLVLRTMQHAYLERLQTALLHWDVHLGARDICRKQQQKDDEQA